MTSRRAIVGTLALALLILGFWFWKAQRAVTPNASTGASHAAANSAGHSPSADPKLASRTAAAASSTERSTLADGLNTPAADIRSDLRLVSDILETFRSNLPRSGNPTGTNAEITAALTGKNQFRLALIRPDHPAINRDGELCDRWGTPFFFHAESATRMEIRSAGPDRKMWTDDDVTFVP